MKRFPSEENKASLRTTLDWCPLSWTPLTNIEGFRVHAGKKTGHFDWQPHHFFSWSFGHIMTDELQVSSERPEILSDRFCVFNGKHPKLTCNLRYFASTPLAVIIFVFLPFLYYRNMFWTVVLSWTSFIELQDLLLVL